MSSKRAVVLMAILLSLLAAYLGPQLYRQYIASAGPAAPAPPLAGTDAISNLVVTQQPDGRWVASVDAFFTGGRNPVTVRIDQLTTIVDGGIRPYSAPVRTFTLERGLHKLTTEIRNPDAERLSVTSELVATMEAHPGMKVLAQLKLPHTIRWPDPVQVHVQRRLEAGPAQAIVDEAVAMIDSGRPDQLSKARRLLQTLVEAAPQVDTAYVELARVAMKTNWSREGLQEAEGLINSALQIRPGSINGSILLGYVYANQGRHKEAQALYTAAAKADPPNLWLWVNWGELLMAQDRPAAAIEKFREAVGRAPAGNTYDLARRHAYRHLLHLHLARGEVDALEAAYRQRANEYPALECHRVDYAHFLLLHRGDVEAATALARDDPSPQCDQARARAVTGLGYYVAWAASKQDDRGELLHRARAFLPVSPELFRDLASSERSLAVARQLVAAGEKIGMKDNAQVDALGYALREGQADAARRLLRLGARPDALAGSEQMPVALIPVLGRDWDGIRLMQRSGVDYAKLRFQGTTAVEHARKSGDTRLLQALDPKSGSL